MAKMRNPIEAPKDPNWDMSSVMAQLAQGGMSGGGILPTIMQMLMKQMGGQPQQPNQMGFENQAE